jgi:putative flippase GtrA
MVSRPTTTAELAIFAWAVLGVVAVLVEAVVRLLPRALEPILDGSLDPAGVLAYVAAIILLAYTEGYRGFQRRFSPRVIVRALALAQRGGWLLIALAPLMAMGLIHATRRRLIGSWVLTLCIVALILLVRLLEQPWRGAVDAGVVVGLSWGTVATLVSMVRALRGKIPPIQPDMPDLPAMPDAPDLPPEQP